MYNMAGSRFKRSKRRKSSNGMRKRVAKLEAQLEPIVKTFEQRIVDNPVASVAQDVAVGNGGFFMDMGKYAPTTNENSYLSAPGVTQNYLPHNLRIGDKITVKSLKVRGSVKCALGTVAGDSNNQLRLMAVLIPDYASIAAGTTAGTLLQQVLQNYGINFSAQAPIYSPYKAYQDPISTGNTKSMIKYKVLWDRKFNLVNTISNFTGGNGSGGSNSKESWRHDFTMDLKFKKGLVCQYDDGLSAGNSNLNPAINNIILLAVSDSTIASHPTVSFTTRMKYIDA